MKPNKKQIDKFIKLLREKLEKPLLPGSDVEYQQIEAFEDYGDFLAQVGEENFEKVTQKIANVLAQYNMARDNLLNDSWDMKNITDSLKKARAFKKTITPKSQYIRNNTTENFLMLNNLLDNFISDLEKICSPNGTGPTKIIPPGHFGKAAKKTKTPLKNLFEEIIKEYQITNHSPNSKKLIDSLY